MKILITPLIRCPKADASYYLTQNLLSLYSQEGHDCAVSADPANGFRNAQAYPAVPLKAPLFAGSADYRSYEEKLYYSGAGSEDYLKKDTEDLMNVVRQYGPDLIITMDRTAAVIASRKMNVRCWAVVNAAMYRNVTVPSKVMKGLNAVLAAYGLEQEFRVHSVYDRCIRRITFGPQETEPFTPAQNVTRFGIPSIFPIRQPQSDRIVFYSSDLRVKPNYLQKTIREAFHGAPYAVYAWYPGCEAQKQDNLRFLSTPRGDLLSGAGVCIHDGNDYLFNECMALAVPQLIITGHDYIRLWNAQAAQRNRFGLYIYEEDFSVSSLYESYRKLVTDPSCRTGAEKMMQKIHSERDLTRILNYTKDEGFL